MALPVLLVNSASGSDTAASGAGPSTALTGTGASTDVAGTTVTLDAGTNLSGVATNGSAVIYMNNTTAGQRRFAKITGSAGSGGATPTVTVAEAFTGSLSGKTWAIGGKRASIGASSSKVLFDNNSAAGDAMPGWIVELQSAHSETIAATFDCRRSGSNSLGPIVLRGESGAATKPLLTFSNNGNAIVSRGTGQTFRDFELRNSNATKTASVGIVGATGAQFAAIGITVAHSTNKFWKGIGPGNGACAVIGCEVGYCANVGIDQTDGSSAIVRGSYVHDNGSHGISSASGGTGVSTEIVGNIVVSNAGDGFRSTIGGFSTTPVLVTNVRGNTFANNASDGIELTGSLGTAPYLHLSIVNNLITGNGGYGTNLSNASANAAALTFYDAILQSNAYYNNTSGATNPSGLDAAGVGFGTVTLTADPFVNAAGGNYALNTAAGGGALCRGAAWPGRFPGGLSTSYADIGAVAARDWPTPSLLIGM